MKKLLAASVVLLLTTASTVSAHEDRTFKHNYLEIKGGVATGLPNDVDKGAIGFTGGRYMNENFAIDGDVVYWQNSGVFGDEDLWAFSVSMLLSTDITSQSGMIFTPYVKAGLSYLSYDAAACAYGKCFEYSETEVSPSGALGFRLQGKQGHYLGLRYTRYFSDMAGLDIGTAMFSIGYRY